MKTEVKVEDLQKLIPSTKSMIFCEIAGVQMIVIALLVFHENIVFSFLSMIGAAVLTVGFEKTKWQNRLKEMMEQE